MEGDRQLHSQKILLCCISIHSLRMEGDKKSFCGSLPEEHFNPLPPHGGRPTGAVSGYGAGKFQSTPSAWRETASRLRGQPWHDHFHPLPPHGGRLSKAFKGKSSDVFQSTPSAWRETLMPVEPGSNRDNFNPLPPHGGRLREILEPLRNCIFQSTPSAWRETPGRRKRSGTDEISIHSLRMEGDLFCLHLCTSQMYFNPLPPHGGRLNNELLAF